MGRRWRLRTAPATPWADQALADWILTIRGVDSVAARQAFLDPAPRPLGDPYLLPEFEQAVTRIETAVRQREPIAVHGDYDADGICAAAILVDAIEAVGGTVSAFLPHRVEDGYGLHARTVQRLADDGFGLIVTVDCGTGAITEAEIARTLGVDLVVTDHHLPAEDRPAVVALVNPQLPESRYPFAELTGAGVALRLAEALLERAGSPTAPSWDLAAIATVADVGPLVGENRQIVSRGIGEILSGRRPGLQALISGAKLGRIDAESIAFGIGPRLNAAGRIGHPRSAYDLLRARTAAEARPLAGLLESYNRERQRLTAQAIAEAQRILAARPARPGPILVSLAAVPAGIIGLVAGQLARELGRSVLVTDLNGPLVTGSARSGGATNVIDVLRSCHELFDRYGGHEGAAGFALHADNLSLLEDRLADCEDIPAEDVLLIDAELEPAALNLGHLTDLERLAPYGSGNPEPLFLGRNLLVQSARAVGQRGNHLMLSLRAGRTVRQAIAFGQADGRIAPGDRIDAAYKVSLDEWNGERRIRLNIADLALAGTRNSELD